MLPKFKPVRTGCFGMVRIIGGPKTPTFMVYLKRHIRGVWAFIYMLMGLAKVSIQISCSDIVTISYDIHPPISRQKYLMTWICFRRFWSFSQHEIHHRSSTYDLVFGTFIQPSYCQQIEATKRIRCCQFYFSTMGKSPSNHHLGHLFMFLFHPKVNLGKLARKLSPKTTVFFWAAVIVKSKWSAMDDDFSLFKWPANWAY